MKTKTMLIGIFSGLIIGGVVGILFAPYKGSDTRRRIMEKSDDYTDAAKEKYNEYVDVINDKIEKVKKEISDFTDVIKGKIINMKITKKAIMN